MHRLHVATPLTLWDTLWLKLHAVPRCTADFCLSHLQVVHHLFPGVCHTHYPAIAPIVQDTCKEFGIPYMIYPTVGLLSCCLGTQQSDLHVAAMPSVPSVSKPCTPSGHVANGCITKSKTSRCCFTHLFILLMSCSSGAHCVLTSATSNRWVRMASRYPCLHWQTLVDNSGDCKL